MMERAGSLCWNGWNGPPKCRLQWLALIVIHRATLTRHYGKRERATMLPHNLGAFTFRLHTARNYM